MVPEARVAAIPPSEALAPGSTGKNSPVARSSRFSSSRVMPGWMRTSMSAWLTSSTRFIRLKSTTTPPRTAWLCPSSEVPVPQAVTGQPWRAQMRTSSETCPVVVG